MNTPKTGKGVHIIKENKTIMSVISNISDRSDLEKSFIVCDLGDVVRKYKEWISLMPRIKPFYAVKANDDLRILKTLTALGAGFDCSSKLEIEKVLGLGVTADRIIFANTVKLIPYICYAASVGVKRMTFDNKQELYKIKKYYPESELLLRIRCDDTLADVVLGMKFGSDYKEEAPGLLKIAQELNLNVIGVCFHVGSGSKNPKIYHKALTYCKEIFDIFPNYGFNFTLLDIGGGFPGESDLYLKPYAEVINPALEKYFPDPNLEIISEPGALFVTSFGKIVTNIHSLRTVEIKDNNGKIIKHNMYYLNNGYYGNFNMFVTHNSDYKVEPLNKNNNGPLFESSLWGPTCDSKDKITNNQMLPQLDIGDWLIFHDLGHYTFTFCSDFNGFVKPDHFFFVRESAWNELKNLKPFDKNDFIVNGFLSGDEENKINEKIK